MADAFQSIESGQGMLKNAYDSGSSPITEALQRKRKRLAETKLETSAETDQKAEQGRDIYA